MNQRPLILGSTSRYRRDLLSRLGIAFDTAAPDIDETPHTHESPQQTAQRLALAKAVVIAKQYPHALVIGSDQVADLEGLSVGKPGTHNKAVAQLQMMSGKKVVFHTAVALVCQQTAFQACDIAQVTVEFRTLSTEEIDRYLRIEQPYDCAGSAKNEGLGISLMQAIHSDDPTALIGLPLIRTCQLLRHAGVFIP